MTIITICAGVLSLGILLGAIWFALTERADDTPETQDDFHASATRWGYLSEKRIGK